MTNRIFISINSGSELVYHIFISLHIEKHFSVCRDEKVIDDVRNRVAAYEDSIRHHHEMVEMATYKDSIANKLLQESNRIKRAMKYP